MINLIKKIEEIQLKAQARAKSKPSYHQKIENQPQNSTLIQRKKKTDAKVLADDKESLKELCLLIDKCHALQKSYINSYEELNKRKKYFIELFQDDAAHAVLGAFRLHLENSKAFPMPCDIRAIIQRNGRKPLSSAVYVGLQKRAQSGLTTEEREYIHEYEKQHVGVSQ